MAKNLSRGENQIMRGFLVMALAVALGILLAEPLRLLIISVVTAMQNL